jgi:phage terminase small subunit
VVDEYPVYAAPPSEMISPMLIPIRKAICWVELASSTRDYQLDTHHLKLLQAACEAWDRACEAQLILSRDGLVIAGREGGVRPHPAVAIRRDAEISFARLLRELDLDTEAPSGLRTAPPSLRSNRRGL